MTTVKTTVKASFAVNSDAARWWVAIEPVDLEFSKPKSPFSTELTVGVEHGVVYYIQAAPGKKFKLTGQAGGKNLFDAIEREVGPKGFAYGHKAFKP